MTRADWALVAQVAASVAAAAAAVFAWRAVRQVKKNQDFERRVAASQQLQTIYLLITDLVVAAHKKEDTFERSMRLRAELAVSYGTALPKCVELVDKRFGGPLTVQELDKIANAALNEVEKAHQVVWKGRMETLTLAIPSEGAPDSDEPGQA